MDGQWNGEQAYEEVALSSVGFGDIPFQEWRRTPSPGPWADSGTKLGLSRFKLNLHHADIFKKDWLRDLDLNQGPSGYEPDVERSNRLKNKKNFHNVVFM